MQNNLLFNIFCMKTIFYLLIPRRLISCIFYRLSRIKVRWFKNLLIKIYQSITKANTDFAIEKNPYKYASLNDFFTRQLDEKARPIDKDEKAIVSPVDGRCAIYQTLDQHILLQAKGFSYPLDLLILDSEKAMDFIDGETATFYLAPDDYHRIHAPIDCQLTSMQFCKGDKHSVALSILDRIPNIFTSNQRLILHFNTSFGKMIMVWVGAMNVGSISTIWEGELRDKENNIYNYQEPLSFKKGDELGKFNLGSTVIIFFEKNSIAWQEEAINNQQKIQMGKKIAQII